MDAQEDLYQRLGVDKCATAAEVKRAYRTLRTKAHPDKGGDAQAFHALTQAYEVLSDANKRADYDATGLVKKGADEEFMDSFAGGAFSDPVRRAAARRGTSVEGAAEQLKEQLVLHPGQQQPLSHTAGFEAWMRSRGSGAAQVYTPDTIAEQFGVVRSSYTGVALPPRQVLTVMCRGAGQPLQQLQLVSQPLPAELEWGQVLVELLYAPLGPGDLYTARLGGIYGEEAKEAPLVMGHDGVGVVTRVGPGVKDLAEGDVVLTQQPLMGTWREAAVWPAKQLLKVGTRPAAGAHSRSTTPTEAAAAAADSQGQAGGEAAAAAGSARAGGQAAAGAGKAAAGGGGEGAVWEESLPLPLEYLAVSRELVVAYQLLAEHGDLKPGDCVILNAPNSTVGRTLLQLCRLLKLRAIALLRPPAKAGGAGGERQWEGVSKQLSELGATLVLRDEGTIKPQMDSLRFFARPKLALDAVGGDSAARLGEALERGGRLVVYGCLSGVPPCWPWQAWVFKGLQVSGYHLPRQMSGKGSSGAAKHLSVLKQLGKLVAAGLLALEFTEYDLAGGVAEGAAPLMLPGAGDKVPAAAEGKDKEQQEWYEALQHALEGPCGGSKVLLRMNQ